MLTTNSKITAEKSKYAHRKEVLNMKDKSKHVCYCSHTQNISELSNKLGKRERERRKEEKKKVILAIKKYLNEIQLTFIVFRGNRCLTVAQIMYFMNDAQKHRELCKMEKHLFLST